MVTLTISSTDPEAIAQAVSSLAGLVDLSVYATPSQLDDPAPDNVLPLCRSDSKDRSA